MSCTRVLIYKQLIEKETMPVKSKTEDQQLKEWNAAAEQIQDQDQDQLEQLRQELEEKTRLLNEYGKELLLMKRDQITAEKELRLIKTQLCAERQEAIDKALDSLSRHKHQMYGYWAAIYVHLNRLCQFDLDGEDMHQNRSPFRSLVNQAKRIHDDLEDL